MRASIFGMGPDERAG